MTVNDSVTGSKVYQSMQKTNSVTRTKSLSNRSQQRSLPVRSATTKHSDTTSSFLKKREPSIVRDVTKRNVLESKNTKATKRRSVEKIVPPQRNMSVQRHPKRIITSGSSSSSSISNSSASVRSSNSSHHSRSSKDNKISNSSNGSNNACGRIAEVSPVDEKQLPWNQYYTVPKENAIAGFIKTDYTDMIQELNASQAFLIASKFSTTSFGQVEELHQKSLQLKATADSVYERIHVQTDTQRATVATLRLELLALGKSTPDMQQLRESSLQIDHLVDELYFSNKRASDLEARYLQNVAGVLAVIISTGNKAIAPPTPSTPTAPPSPHENSSYLSGLKLVKKIESLFQQLELSHESIIDNSMSDDSELLSPSSARFSKQACASDTTTDTDTEESLDDLALYQKLNILVDGLSERWKQKEDHIATLEASTKQNVEKNHETEQQNTVELEKLGALLNTETLKRQALQDKLKITEENYSFDQKRFQKEIQELKYQFENESNQLINENKDNQVLIQNLKSQLEEISQNEKDALQRSQILQQQNDDFSKYITNSYNTLLLKRNDSYEPTDDAKKAIHMFLEEFHGLEKELEIYQQANQTQKEKDKLDCNTIPKNNNNLLLTEKQEERTLNLLNNDISGMGNKQDHRAVSEKHDLKENNDVMDYICHQHILEQQLMDTQRQLGLLKQQYQTAQQVYITRESGFILQSASLEAELERIVKEYCRLTRNICDFYSERKKWQHEIHRLNNDKQELDKKLSDERLKRIAQDGQTKTLRKEFRTMIASVKDDHALAINREIGLRGQIEQALRDMKTDEEMKRWERVDIAIQTEFDETIIAAMRTTV